MVKSAQRTAQILDLFQTLGRPARARDIGAALHLAPSSTDDLLKALVEVGLLTRDETDKTYFPSLRLAAYGHWLGGVYAQAPALMSLMSRLRDESGESVVLTTRNGARLQFAMIVPGRDAPPPNVTEGRSVPMLGSAAGGAALMAASDSAIPDMVRRETRLRPGRQLDRAISQAFDQVQAFRRRGYARTMRDDITPTAWALAMPLPAPLPGGDLLVLGLGGPQERVRAREAELASLMQSHAARCFAG